MILNLIAAASITLMGITILLYIYPELRRRFKEEIVQDDPSDEHIHQCLHDSWVLMAQINSCVTKNELEAIYWDVEHFEQHYCRLVPATLLHDQTMRLFETITLKRDHLRTKLKVV